MKPTILAVIPVSGEDVEFERGILRLGSRSVLDFTFEAAKSSKLIGRTIVSTDDKRISRESKRVGIEVPFLRPPGTRLLPIGQILKQAVEYLENQDKNYRPDWIVRLQVTYPFREPSFIDRAVRTVLSQDLDSAFVAFPEYESFWYESVDGTPQRITTDIEVPRSDRTPIYREIGGLFSMISREVIGTGMVYGQRLGIIPIKSGLAPIDLHGIQGIELARLIARSRESERIAETS